VSYEILTVYEMDAPPPKLELRRDV
jgi:hypothetical protein